MKLFYKTNFIICMLGSFGAAVLFGGLFLYDMWLGKLPEDNTIILYWLPLAVAFFLTYLEYRNIGKNYIELNMNGMILVHDWKKTNHPWSQLHMVYIYTRFLGIPTKGLFCIYTNEKGYRKSRYLGAAKKLIEYVQIYTEIEVTDLRSLQKCK